MFEKLLSVLPYNPGLLHQMSFYSRRMREESLIRRTGLVFIVLAFMIQFFAVINPPVSTVAASNNDLINGGFSSAADAASDCRNNVQGYKDILNYYGITCDEVANAATVTINSHDHNGNLFSMGRLPYGSVNPNSGSVTEEQPVTIDGTTVYVRLLSSFDTGSNKISGSSYEALRVTNSAGDIFWLEFPCGNLVAVGVPHKPITPCQYNINIAASSPECFKPCLYNSSIPASSAQCFTPCPIPGKSSLPQSSPQCYAPCPYNSAISASNSNCFPPCQYNKAISANSAQCFAPCPYNSSLAANSPQCYQPCQYNSAIASNDSECKPCEESLSSQDTLSCVVFSKKAANLTQNVADANNTTAQPGDVILYTLNAQNNGKVTIKKFVFQENLSDVLVYANVTDLHGGSIDSNNLVTWPAVDIAAGATASEQITVTVKNPVPQTAADPGDPNEFDLTMTNVYGNTINIHVPGSPPKTVETAAAALPNTGPGTGLFVAAAVTVIAAYFWGRARLLARESALAIQESSGA